MLVVVFLGRGEVRQVLARQSDRHHGPGGAERFGDPPFDALSHHRGELARKGDQAQRSELHQTHGDHAGKVAFGVGQGEGERGQPGALAAVAGTSAALGRYALFPPQSVKPGAPIFGAAELTVAGDGSPPGRARRLSGGSKDRRP